MREKKIFLFDKLIDGVKIRDGDMILGRKERDIKVGGEVFKMSFSSR